jgi:hypothetical protein
MKQIVLKDRFNLKDGKLNLTLSILLTVNTFLLNAQTPIQFYKVLGGDSISMFFNDNYRYVDIKCATYARYSNLDKGGNFNGWFKDYQQDPGVLRATGYYVNGKKNGLFTLFYENGKIQSRGEYVNSMPRGTWEFFRDNGLPEREISITQTDTLLIRLVSAKGDLLVDKGEGEFEGLVCGNLSSKNDIMAKGRIQNGKPVGRWTSVLQGASFCIEEFDDQGKFVKGVFPEAQAQKKKHYKSKSFLANLIPASYLTSLETINLEGCSETYSSRPIKQDFNVRNFNDELRSKLNDVFIEDIRTGKYSVYQEEETHYMTIEFKIEEDSKLSDFKMLTNWGSNFYYTVVAAIKRNAHFSGGTGKMYFHLRLTSRSTRYYAWTFNFSQSEEIKF